MALLARSIEVFPGPRGYGAVVAAAATARLEPRVAAPPAAVVRSAIRDEFVDSDRQVRRGMVGGAVEALQHALVRLGYLSAGEFATGPGVFGPRTDRAVRRFQSDRGLLDDGVVDAAAWQRLRAALARLDAPTASGDGSAPTSVSIDSIAAHRPVDAPLTSDPANRSAERYVRVIDQFDVAANPRYRPRNGRTFCNIFVWDVSRAMGAEIPHWWAGRELDANATAAWMRMHGPARGWRRVGAAEAQAHASAGRPAVGLARVPGGVGHAVLVRPGALTQRGPAIAQAGAVNLSRARADDVFRGQEPEYWVHP